MAEYSVPTGGMWERKDRNGRTYFFIEVEIDGMKHRYHAFVNTKRGNDKHPHFRLFSLGDPVQAERSYTPRPRVTEENYAVKYDPEREDDLDQVDATDPTPDEDDDDRPF